MSKDKQVQEIFNELKRDPVYNPNNTVSEKDLLKKAESMSEEFSAPFTIIDGRYNLDILTQFEIVTALLGRIDLIGILVHFYYLASIGLLYENHTDELAEMVGLSIPTFRQKRDELEKMGFLELKKQGKKIYYIPRNAFKIHNFKLPKDIEERKKYIKKLRGEIIPITSSFLEEQQEKEKKRQEQQRINELVKERMKKEKEKITGRDKTFPNEDYLIVLNGYKKYKRVGLMGQEVIRAKRAIKNMFLSNRSPKQIVDCMAFFAKNKDMKGYEWLRSWTLETVMKKIPEFLAGQLKEKRMEDQYQELQ